MKKTLIVLMMVLLTVSVAFADRGVMDVSVGALAQYNGELESLSTSSATTVENYQFGPEVRVKFTMLEIDAAGLLSKSGDKVAFNGFTTAGASFDLAICRIAVGMGPDTYYTFGEKDSFQLGPMNDAQQDKITANGGDPADPTFVQMLFTAPMNLRATADFLVGNLNLGVSATLPTNFSLDSVKNWKESVPTKDDLKRVRLGVSLGFDLI